MKKLIVIPDNLDLIKSTIELTDGYIIGVNGLSENIQYKVEINELSTIVKYLKENNKQVHIYLNKNIKNEELELLENAMKEIEFLEVDTIIYYDIAVINLKNKYQLKTPLVWGQEHFSTNYQTINFWKEHGADYTWLSSDITLSEIVEIANNTTSKLMIQVFGHLPMFASFRNLVKSYLNNFDKKGLNEKYYIKEKQDYYPAIDNEYGTTIYSAKVLNAVYEIDELMKNKINLFVLNAFNIDSEKFVEVLKMYKNVNNENVEEYMMNIDNMFNTDRGFLYKETVYKVKNNE